MDISFGNLLRRSRMEKGYTQDNMAAELHTTRSTISKLENDEQHLRATDLFRWIQKTDSQDLFYAFAIDAHVLIDVVASASSLVSFILPFIA